MSACVSRRLVALRHTFGGGPYVENASELRFESSSHPLSLCRSLVQDHVGDGTIVPPKFQELDARIASERILSTPAWRRIVFAGPCNGLPHHSHHVCLAFQRVNERSAGGGWSVLAQYGW